MKYDWSYLIHMSTNMWNDLDPAQKETFYRKIRCLSPDLLLDENVYFEWIGRMKEAGMNQVILDVGDAVVYPSHPEIAIRGSWSAERLQGEVRRLKALGIEAIPKLNFSTCHDSWLKDYHRMVSSSDYYAVCTDIIRDIAEIFDHPRFLHLGYDEETANQGSNFVAVRQGELWWHDFLWFCETTRKAGMRPWAWADAAWGKDEEFCRRCPKDVLLSNWYYGGSFPLEDRRIKTYIELSKHGFDQVPTGSNWSCPQNFGNTVDFAIAHLDPAHLKGYCMATWARTLPPYRNMGARALDIIGATIARIERGKTLDIHPEAMWVSKDGQIVRWQHLGDRFGLYPGETLMLDYARAGRYRPVIDIDSIGGKGVRLTVTPGIRLNGTLVEAEGPVQVETLAKADRHLVLAATEYRYLQVTADKMVCVTLADARPVV